MIVDPQAWAKQNHFKLLRDDRGAYEYVATKKTPKDHFENAYAFTIHDCIFYESMRIANKPSLQKHELMHVDQSYRLGRIIFDVWYGIETFIFGYKDNRFEKEAQKAEKKKVYPTPARRPGLLERFFVE